MSVHIKIRQTTAADLPDILSIHRAAFPEEPVTELTAALLTDPSAKPLTSLVAIAEGKAVGHILFTAARLEPETSDQISILAPLAVVSEYQGQGIGSHLVSKGLEMQAKSGVGMVFVLGYPAYYTKFGFRPAGERGFAAPYPILEKNADAWMVLPLRGQRPNAYSGKVRCATALAQPEYWRE